MSRLVARIHRGALLAAVGLAIAGPLVYLEPESAIAEVTATALPWHAGALVRVHIANKDARRHVWVRSVDLSQSFVGGGRVFGAASSETPSPLGDTVRFSRDDDLAPGAATNVDAHVVWAAQAALRAGFVDVVFEDTSSLRVPFILQNGVPAIAPGADFAR